MLLNFQGSDQYRMRQAVKELIERQPQDGLTVKYIDASQEDQMTELEKDLKYPSFFQESKVIVLQNTLSDSQTSERTLGILNQYDVSKDATLSLVILDNKTGRTSSASKKLREHLDNQVKPEVFEPLTGTSLYRWISDFCIKRGASIQATATNALLKRLPQDSWLLALELEKLCAYANGQEITAASIDELAPIFDERNEFELTDAVYNHDKRAMIAAIWRRLSDGAAEQLMFGTVVSGIRTILMALSAQKRGLSSSLASKTFGVHPFVMQKAFRGAPSYDEKRLLDTYKKLAELDRQAKDGRADMVDGLMSILIAI